MDTTTPKDGVFLMKIFNFNQKIVSFEVPLQQAFGQSVGFFLIYRKAGFFQRLNTLPGEPSVGAETAVGHTASATGRDDLRCLLFSLLRQKNGQAGVAVYAEKYFS